MLITTQEDSFQVAYANYDPAIPGMLEDIKRVTDDMTKIFGKQCPVQGEVIERVWSKGKIGEYDVPVIEDTIVYSCQYG